MMSPNEYDAMVEHLAAEIIDDCLEKQAAPRKGRIDAYEEVYSQPAQSKLIDANIARDNSRLRRAELREELKAAKKAGDKEKAEEVRRNIGSEKKKRNAAIITQLNPMNAVRAIGEYNARMPLKYKFNTVGALSDAQVAANRTIAKRYAEQMAEKAAFEEFGLFEKGAAEEGNLPLIIAENSDSKKKNIANTAYQYAKDGVKAAGKLVKDHPYISSATAASALAAGAGLAAYKHNKKKKEDQKEKVAAYYEDALEKSAAAENVWAFANQFEDTLETLLMKQAAEEAYEEAMAQAEAAENVYGALVEDEYIDDDFEGDEE